MTPLLKAGIGIHSDGSNSSAFCRAASAVFCSRRRAALFGGARRARLWALAAAWCRRPYSFTGTAFPLVPSILQFRLTLIHALPHLRVTPLVHLGSGLVPGGLLATRPSFLQVFFTLTHALPHLRDTPVLHFGALRAMFPGHNL